MTIIEVETILDAVLLDARVWLENREIRLGYDGARTWKSIDRIELTADVLHIIFHGVGVADTEWKITVNELQPNQKASVIDGSGMIQPSGHSFVIYAGQRSTEAPGSDQKQGANQPA